MYGEGAETGGQAPLWRHDVAVWETCGSCASEDEK